ncbi:MAG TPA: right-handed parallel beta-helix repeat-containing protein [Candidatus Nitrosocosmicus sp.]|nr:right-handed parallel beta-helix repeat-containing protein [Candidatus Nitrosocosmicus sp.]
MRTFQMIGIILPLFFISINMVHASSYSTTSELTLLPSTEMDYPNGNMNTIEIQFSNSYQASTGSFYVNGAFKNVGDRVLENAKVIGYFYDENKKMIGVTDCCNTDPDTIEPEKTARFESFATENTMAGVPKYYKLSFEWDEPETNTIDPASNVGSDRISDSNSNTEDDVTCGDVIKFDITLTSNLYCDSDGLIIGSDDITVNLNGYTISGPGEKSSKVGIMLRQNSEIQIFGNGTITNFQAGILNSESENIKIINITLTGNEIGIFNTGSSKTEINNNSFNSNSVGIAGHSSDNFNIIRNNFNSNDLAGITFVNSGESTINSNTVTGSVNGIFFDGQSTENEINANNAFENRGVDLNNGNGLPTNINSNVFSDNNCNTSVPDGLCLGNTD